MIGPHRLAGFEASFHGLVTGWHPACDGIPAKVGMGAHLEGLREFLRPGSARVINPGRAEV